MKLTISIFVIILISNFNLLSNHWSLFEKHDKETYEIYIVDSSNYIRSQRIKDGKAFASCLLKTDDKGKTWDTTWMSRFTDDFYDRKIYSIKELDKNTFLAGMSQGLIIRTEDNCKNWDTVLYRPDWQWDEASHAKISFRDKQNGIAAFMYQRIYFFTSNDAGKSWKENKYLETFNPGIENYAAGLNGIERFGNDIIYLYQICLNTYNRVLLKSTDGGETFSYKILDQNLTINSLHFLDQNTILGFGIIKMNEDKTPIIYKSVDAGETWEEIYRGYKQTLSIKSAQIIDSENWYFVNNDQIIKTNDGGKTWSEESFDRTLSEDKQEGLTDIHIKDNLAFMTDYKGNIWKMDNDISVISKNEDHEFNVYPNPCNKGNYINIDFDGLELNEIKLIDLFGNAITLQKDMIYNNQQIKIPNNISQGTYYLVLEGNKRNFITKIIII